MSGTLTTNDTHFGIFTIALVDGLATFKDMIICKIKIVYTKQSNPLQMMQFQIIIISGQKS